MTGEKSGEFRAKSLEAAITAGLAALQLSRDEVEVEIVRPGSRGVLGIGAEDAIVRLTEQRGARIETPVKIETQPVAPAKTENKPAPAPKAESRPAPKTTVRSEPKPEPVKAVSTAPADPDDKAWAAAQIGQEFLTPLLGYMGLDAQIEITTQSDAESEEDERVPVLNIVGEDLGVLIGRQNEVLSAVEFITRLAVNQRSHSRSQFTVDVNGYRAKRAESLRKLALRMADQALQSGRTVTLEPMPPAERRIIHLALRDHARVFTQSVGEGDRRKVTVVLKKD